MLGFPVIDGHFHIWPAGDNYPWLQADSPPISTGDHAAIKRPMVWTDYLSQIGSFVELDGVVHSEASASNPVAETEWVLAAIDECIPVAHVAGLHMGGHSWPEQLTRVSAFPRVRGLRFRLNSDPRRSPDRLAPDAPELDAPFEAIARSRLVFDLSIFVAQAETAARRVECHPQLRFVLNHLGWPRIEDGIDSVRDWQSAMNLLSRHRNLYVKLSMLWPIHRGWRADAIRPFAMYLVETFGPERILWGSNWPIETLVGDPDAQLTELLTALEGLTEQELRWIFNGTARSLYGLTGSG